MDDMIQRVLDIRQLPFDAGSGRVKFCPLIMTAQNNRDASLERFLDCPITDTQSLPSQV